LLNSYIFYQTIFLRSSLCRSLMRTITLDCKWSEEKIIIKMMTDVGEVGAVIQLKTKEQLR